ncbi:MAG: hypothetical protein GEU73_02595 [Chloroflexi bacterium]|nr:hypothetical protein [Chloroflexota bacterium]
MATDREGGIGAMSVSAEMIRLFYDLWDETRPGREYIATEHLPDSIEKIPRSNSRDVNLATELLNRIGHLLSRGLLDVEFVTSLVGKEAIRIATRLKPFLAEARERRSDPEFCAYVDYLLTVCEKAYPDYEPRYPEERRTVGLLSST